jgi:hypothetical protein
VSCTSYQLEHFAQTDPRRYLNAEVIPYAVVPGWLRREAVGVILGCYGVLENLDNGLSVPLMVGDEGPAVGEFSCAALKVINVNPDPRNGGNQNLRYRCTLFPGKQFTFNGFTYPLIPL